MAQDAPKHHIFDKANGKIEPSGTKISAIETWPGVETISKQHLVHTQERLDIISAVLSFLSS